MSLPPLVEPAAELTRDEVNRYSRHLIIPDVGMAGQKRLKNSKVLVVGAGGLGSPALLYLAAAGVGTLGVIDFDVVDESNLQRQIIHRQSSLGRPKVESAAETVREINPLITVVEHNTALDRDNIMDIFAQYDLILDGTDNFATRYMVNDAAVLLGKPYVWGSIYRFDGQASVFWAEHGPCYRCLYPEPPPPGMVPVLRGGRRPGRAVLLDRLDPGERGHQAAHRHRRAPRRPPDDLRRARDDLPVGQGPQGPRVPAVRQEPDVRPSCGGTTRPSAARSRRRPREAAQDSTISVTDLKAMQDNGDDIFLVDVREPNEYEIVSIPGATLIPKGEFLDGSALEKLPQDKKIVLHCKSGGRSAEALAVVKKAGFSDAVHVGGGVLAWVKQIDPSLPTY